MKEVQEYYDPKPSVIVQRFPFNTRERAASESIATYVASLRRLAEYCDFGETLNVMIRDRLVYGVKHDTIQTRLLAEKELSFDKALQLAQAVEAAEMNSKILKKGTASVSHEAPKVLYAKQGKSCDLEKAKGDRPTPTCYCCGGPHLAPECSHIDTQCRYCKKKGHLAKVCRAKQKKASEPTSSNSQPEKVHLVQQHQQDQEKQEVNSYNMFTVSATGSVDPIIATVYINSVPMEMELDTGASVSVEHLPAIASIWHLLGPTW